MTSKSKIASFFNALFVNFHHLKPVSKIEQTVKSMGHSEKIFLSFLAVIIAVSGTMLAWRVNKELMTEVPAFGGGFTEGVVGSPRFVNPVLAISSTDQDLVALVYSGLLKQSEEGYAPDLAESYSVSEDGLTYDVALKSDAYFHDGQEVVADDVIFTIEKVLDPVIKSPQKSAWDGVTVEKISDREVRFVLKKPYSGFLANLTLGILPKHIWSKVTSEEFPFSSFNIDPVGAGPYRVSKISRNSGGIPTGIALTAWKKYASEMPKIKSIVFKFFQNETELAKAYESGSVESASGLSPESARKIGAPVVEGIALPRVFGVFFNQNLAPVFLNKEVRQALDLSAPKKAIVEETLYGFGRVLNGPTPDNLETDEQKASGDIEAAKELLTEAGWEENENGILQKKTKSGTDVLSFSISTSDAPELKRAAEMLKDAWMKLGAAVEVKVFESGDLSQNVIKPRKYDALLFGEVIGQGSDLYSFWHSSQRNEPGLNISLYANISVDKALENLQKEKDPEVLREERETVFAEIRSDIPAVFLFSPNLLYVPSGEVKALRFKDVSSLSERFIFLNKWFIETDKVWNFLVDKI